MTARGRDHTVIINATNLGRLLDGIGVYTLNLLRQLSKLKTHLRFVIYVNRSCAEHLDSIYFQDHCSLRWVSDLLSPDHRFRGHLLRLMYANFLSLKHRKSLIFATSQLEAVFFRRKQIITIHDIIPLLFKKYHKKQYYYYKYILRHVLNSARGVITPSEHTKGLLIQMYGLDGTTIHVIHNGVRLGTVHRTANYNETEKFILYVGRIVRMKNLEGVLRAFALIEDRVPHKLVIAGNARKQLAREFEVAQLPKYGISSDRVVFKGYVSTDEMVHLIRKAAVLVFPSFYEGFGLPPLEAMSYGCPVVVSNVASLPEVCGDAAIYVDPYDANSIAVGIQKVLVDNMLRQDLVRKGLEQAKLFSWPASAQQHLRILAEEVQPSYVHSR